MSEPVPGIVEAFPAQFDACWELGNFAQAHRPDPSRAFTGDADAIIVRTYARSTKTFGAAIRHAGRGYGVQAGMLGRSLFEDMLVAHWIRRHADNAPAKMERHHQHNLELFREGLAKYGRAHELAHVPGLSPAQREALASEFGRRHWTGLSLLKIAQEVEDEWTEEHLERRMLWQVFDITHLMNNLLLHHSTFALENTVEMSEPGVMRLDVGPSKIYVHEALLAAWFSYGNTCSLVLDAAGLAELNELFGKRLTAFAAIRETGSADDVPGSGGAA